MSSRIDETERAIKLTPTNLESNISNSVIVSSRHPKTVSITKLGAKTRVAATIAMEAHRMDESVAANTCVLARNSPLMVVSTNVMMLFYYYPAFDI
jgi:hypothetical protein